MKIFKTKIEKVKEYLIEIGAKDSKHVRGTLYAHLCRVSDILIRWDCDEDTVLAGLCHSVYNTEYFKGNLVNINSNKIREIIGDKADDIVREWRVMDRENINMQSKDVIAMSHILLANEIDHLSIDFISGAMHSAYRRYRYIHKLLNNKAKRELYKIINAHDLDDLSLPAPQVETSILFTGHSGVTIKNDKLCVAIDPWLFPSTKNKPIIDGLHPSQCTIDYMIPESRNSVIDISPDIVLLSHYHTHHSPITEIIEFAKIKPIQIFCPTMNDNELLQVKNKMGDYIYSRITFRFLDKDESIISKGLEIRAFLHQAERGTTHFIYYLRLGDKSLLHVVDANVNYGTASSEFSNWWSRLYVLEVDYLFVGAAGHISRAMINGERYLREHTSLTPIQAAKLAVRLGVRYTGIIGIYNHSVWDDRAEMGLSSGEAESQFYWALSWLAPAIKVLYLRPGDRFK